MSTTTHKEMAIDYSGVKDQRGTVLEIEVGRVDVGASVSFLSQYPGEAEFLMQPLACLEVCPRSGRSRLPLLAPRPPRNSLFPAESLVSPAHNPPTTLD
jgi:hypothetical protein